MLRGSSLFSDPLPLDTFRGSNPGFVVGSKSKGHLDYGSHLADVENCPSYETRVWPFAAFKESKSR